MPDTRSVINQSSTSAYSYFRKALRSLRLNEFPCGTGSWRNPKAKKPDGTFMVTGKDYGAQYEKVEQLLDYLDSNDWESDTTWSKEAEELKRLVVLNPWSFEDEDKCIKFVHTFIKSLQFRDKNIDNVDKKMLKFENLEELVLTANRLSDVNSTHLPSKLQVLELGSNAITSISALCLNPPSLLHLGLSYNQITHPSQYKYFTNVHWPHLMSLDLSFNNLSNFGQLTDALLTLTKLRNLNLTGNPLSLTPSYRGIVVDVLKNLAYLDDVIISPDERHHFKGLGKMKDLAREECCFTINMAGLCGLPIPYELQDIERPEYPVVSTQYFVSYKMLQDGDKTVDRVAVGEAVTLTSAADDADVVCNQTNFKQYGKVVDLQYKKCHRVTKLLKLRDFLNNGIKLCISSKTVKSWLAEASTDEHSGSSKRCKSPPKPSAGKSGKSSEKEKKKEKEVQLRQDPPEFHEVGSCIVDTACLLGGQSNTISSICYCGGGPQPPVDQLAALVDLNQGEETSKGSDRKSKKESKKERTTSIKSPTPCDQVQPVKPPMLVDFKLYLRRWQTAADCNKST